jgi:predicted subunit of tRNA(5-methylaminomethyl-2-thiouridylate) methyltransferase
VSERDESTRTAGAGVSGDADTDVDAIGRPGPRLPDGERPVLALCFSGGKDSTLAALLLDAFYDVRLVTAHFGVTDAWRHAREAADALGYPFETVVLDRAVASTAVERIRADGYPRNGIQHVHERALEAVADLDVGAVADGTRRDDRVPTVSRAQAQSLEDRHGVDYIAPLSGFGRGAVDRLVDATLDVEVGPSETVPKADYETELRTLLMEAAGEAAVDDVFPAHTQTRVRGFR